ncbi:MAG: hypothetical protein QME52_13415 [Bacteroidota bacterium]|nr:hypothetical protein [Bacteroidota bacterium]
MHHIDEHTIELYILGSDLVKKQITEIEAHLKECHGCRALTEQIEVFYQNAEEELDKLSVPKEQATKALMRLPRDIMPYDMPLGAPVPYRPITFVGKLAYFNRLHPVVTGIGSFATMAVMALILFSIPNKKTIDQNPSYPILDPVSGSLAIYNKDHDMLWSIPSKILPGANPDLLLPIYKFINIYDINGDGRNEIITALPIGNQNNYTDTLRIFSARKDILLIKTFDEKIQFRGKSYDEHWTISNIYCDRIGNEGNLEIFLLTNNGRSPNILFRLNNYGNIIGYFVHYGLQQMIVLENSAGDKNIFLHGQNDLGEIDSLSSPVLIVLDPEKINGKTESSCTPGFDLETSKAEQYYIKLPLTDLNYLCKTNGYVGRATTIKFENKNAYDLWIGGTYEKETPVFEYILSEEMEVLSVKYSSETLKLRQKLIAEGKIKGTFDDAYLENLKNGVRYWDGKEWQKEPTMVKH